MILCHDCYVSQCSIIECDSTLYVGMTQKNMAAYITHTLQIHKNIMNCDNHVSLNPISNR